MVKENYNLFICILQNTSTLEGKMSVQFAKDFAMTSEELLNV